MTKKSKSALSNKRRARADEIWLAVHAHACHSTWPMATLSENRRFELDLLRYGIRNAKSPFDRIIYLHADGGAAGLHGGGEIIPKKIELDENDGYPAFSRYCFCFSFFVPMPGLGSRTYEFSEFAFQEVIVPPKDSWMAGAEPNNTQPDFFAYVATSSEAIEVEMLIDGQRMLVEPKNTTEMIGKQLNFVAIYEAGISKVRYQAVT